MDKVRYSDVRDQIRTGDVFLFRGEGLASTVIRTGQQLMQHEGWEYTHIAMAAWVTPSHTEKLRESGIQFPPVDYERLLCWESTTLSNMPDLQQQMYRGVQCTYASGRIANYSGRVFWRPVMLERAAESMDIQFIKLWADLNGAPYEQSRRELALSALNKWGGNYSENLNTVFCSELVAESWQRFGWFDEDVPSNQMCPAEFAAKFPRGVRVTLGNIVELEI